MVSIKNTLLREAQEGGTLRSEFFASQEKILGLDIRIPFVFYDYRCCACSNFLGRHEANVY